jgi:hypothetical protein
MTFGPLINHYKNPHPAKPTMCIPLCKKTIGFSQKEILTYK